MQQEYTATLARLHTSSNAERLSREKELVHLLKRTLIGVSCPEYLELAKKPLAEVIHILTDARLPTTSPLKDYSSVSERTPDYKVKFGETWVHDINFDNEVNNKRKQSLRKWLTGLLYTDKKSLRPSMVLFWHHYFPIQINRITLAVKVYDYFSTLINFSLENYKDLVLHGMTSFTMLEFHKKINTTPGSLYKAHSHQLLGYLFGSDYSTYLSKDRVKRFTRLISEWNRINDELVLSVSRLNTEVTENSFIQYNALSIPENYKRAIITDFISEATEVINKLLQFEQAAHVLAEKLFCWFIHFDTSKRTAKKIIKKVSHSILENNYDIKKILTTLLLQEDIYTTQYFGCLTKKPVEFVFGLCKELNGIMADPGNHIDHYQQWEWLLRYIETFGLTLGDPPFNMEFYAQQPYLKQKAWITSETLQQSEQLITRLLNSHIQPGNGNNSLPLINYLAGFHTLDSLTEFLILYFTHTHYSPGKKESILQFIKQHYQVTNESWMLMQLQLQKYPQDTVVKAQVIAIVKRLVEYFLKAPEYYYY